MGMDGVYEALVKNKMTDKMRNLGVKWVFIGGGNFSKISIFPLRILVK